MWVNVPNLISLARLFAVPVAVWLILKERYDFAFWLFTAAGATDALDGFIAKKFDARTTLGSFLDPLADKALLVSVFVALGYVGKLDDWIVILVVSRDVMIVGAALLSFVLFGSFEAKPSRISKLNTLAQIVLAGVVLAEFGLNLPFATLAEVLVYIVAVTTTASGGLYAVAWVRHASKMEDAQ
ncbi:MAG: CDP-alcohol phosphatidyltransferase family protein [Alphaproteobacteria bacterium]